MSKLMITAIVTMLAAGTAIIAEAQTDKTIMTRAAMRLENQTDWFKESLDDAFDNNRMDGTIREDEINAFVQGFEMATDRYARRAASNQVIPSDIESLLISALIIEETLSKVPATEAARRDWLMVRSTLDTIAKRHNVVWVWTLNSNPFWKTARIEPIFDRLEMRSDEFEESFDHALDMSKLNGTKLEDEANALVSKFEENIDALETRVDKAEAITSSDIDRVIQQGMLIDAFMMANNLTSPRVWSDWWQVKASLRELAMRSNTAWTWTYKPVVTKTVGTK